MNDIKDFWRKDYIRWRIRQQMIEKYHNHHELNLEEVFEPEIYDHKL